MRVVVLPAGSVVIKEEDTVWMFDCPAGTADELKAAGIDKPQAVLMTQVRSPGLYDLGPVMTFKEKPLGMMNGLKAVPIKKLHGVDYVITNNEGDKIFYSSRGDVSVGDVEGATLAIIKNKHRADAFGENVITWPWIEAEYDVSGGKVQEVSSREKEDLASRSEKSIKKTLQRFNTAFVEQFGKEAGQYVNIDDVDLEKKVAYVYIDGALYGVGYSVTEDDITYVPRDKWFDAISVYQPASAAGGYDLVSNTKEIVGGEPVRRFGDVLTAALHKAYNDISDYYYGEGFLDQEERLSVAQAIGPGLKAVREGLPETVMSRIVKEEETESTLAQQLKDRGWTTVWKDDEGDWNWASISSVTMLDNHTEVLTPKAMRWAIKFAEVVGKGPLRYRHAPGIDGGDCTHQAEVGGFLFERGKFRNTPVGLAMRRKMQKDPETQVSLGLLFNENDLLNKMFYKRAAIFERSLTKAPAVTYTATITSGGKVAMKVNKLSDEQLSEIAAELELPLEQVKALHEQAISNGEVSFTQKEFTDAVIKAAASYENSDDEDDEDAEDADEGKARKQIKAAIKDMSEEERKELRQMIDDVDETPTRTGISKDMREVVAAVKENTALIQQLVSLSRQNSPATDRLARIFKETPRRQQPHFLSQGEGEGVTDDDDVTAILKEVRDALKGNSVGGAGFYDRFTSSELNRGFGHGGNQ